MDLRSSGKVIAAGKQQIRSLNLNEMTVYRHTKAVIKDMPRTFADRIYH